MPDRRPAITREHRLAERMIGDPRFEERGGLMTRRACQYSAAMLRRRGQLPDDASPFEARWSPELRTVTFWRGPNLVAAHRIPDRVMDYDPYAAAVALSDRDDAQSEAATPRAEK